MSGRQEPTIERYAELIDRFEALRVAVGPALGIGDESQDARGDLMGAISSRREEAAPSRPPQQSDEEFFVREKEAEMRVDLVGFHARDGDEETTVHLKYFVRCAGLSIPQEHPNRRGSPVCQPCVSGAAFLTS